jgi:hypothetical protein
VYTSFEYLLETWTWTFKVKIPLKVGVVCVPAALAREVVVGVSAMLSQSTRVATFMAAMSYAPITIALDEFFVVP